MPPPSRTADLGKVPGQIVDPQFAAITADNRGDRGCDDARARVTLASSLSERHSHVGSMSAHQQVPKQLGQKEQVALSDTGFQV